MNKDSPQMEKGMTNTKERHEEIYNATVEAIEKFGGAEVISNLSQGERLKTMRQLYRLIMRDTDCVRDTARRNVDKALRRANQRKPDNWGGPRPNQTGRPPTDEPNREAVSTRLAPGSKDLAQAVAEIKGLPGWGHAVDKALVRWVNEDRELKVSLAEMGIIIKNPDLDGDSGE